MSTPHVIYDELNPRESAPQTPRGAVRQVLIPHSGKTMQHPWRIVLAQSRGEILPDDVDEHYDYQRRRVQYVMERRSHRRLRGRFRSGGTPYRNPARINRLAKNGRLRKDLPADSQSD